MTPSVTCQPARSVLARDQDFRRDVTLEGSPEQLLLYTFAVFYRPRHEEEPLKKLSLRCPGGIGNPGAVALTLVRNIPPLSQITNPAWANITVSYQRAGTVLSYVAFRLHVNHRRHGITCYAAPVKSHFEQDMEHFA